MTQSQAPQPTQNSNSASQSPKQGTQGSAFSRLGKLAAKAAPQQIGDGAQAATASKAAKPDAKPRTMRESDVANGLLNLEREARKANSETELGYLMVNGSRIAVQYRQGLLLKRSGKKKYRVSAVSSLSAVDRNSTFVRWVEAFAQRNLVGENLTKVWSIDVRKEAQAGDLDAQSYPFSQVAFVPLLLRDGTVFAHVMFTREAEWDEPSLVAAARLCETYSHAWESLSGPKRIKRKLRSKTAFGLIACAAIVAAGFYPVPLTVLSPAEVTAANPFVVAAPIDGVIASIKVDPNTFVEKGSTLFGYSDTDLRNQLKLAGQAVSVAEARYSQSMRTSFADPSAKRELSIAKSELQLKAGEYDYAKELLDNSVVKAQRAGLVIFADKDQWTGRPVSTGERIMRIADPSMVELTVNLPASDSIVLKEGAKVQMYLDSAPLKSIDAIVKSASFHATPDAGNTLSYKVKATFSEAANKPRIGLRGTAQLHGEEVSLGYYLFRKPLSAIRQWTGM